MRNILAVAGFVFVFGIQPAFAEVPQLINYQGRLLSGTNLANGAFGISLRLFSLPSGGSSIYEDSNSVTVADGLYSTFIGDQTNSGNFATALTNAQVWVEVAVNGTTLTPRERLASVAYALNAQTAIGVVAGGITSTMLADGSVTAPKLASNAVTTSAIADGAVTAPKVAQALDNVPTFSQSLAAPATNALGFSLAPAGTNWFVAGAPGQAIGTFTFSGSASLYDSSGSFILAVTNPTPGTNDYFGYTVASVGSNRFLVGAIQDMPGITFGAGSAFLYDLNGTLLATMTNPTATAAYFSYGIAGVGTNWFVIGAPQETSGAPNSGVAYLYDATGVLVATMTNPVPTTNGYFGLSAAGIGGSMFALGAAGTPVGTNSNVGVVHIYNVSGTLLTTITNPVVDSSAAQFGWSLATLGTNRLVIGANYAKVGTNAAAGVAHVYNANGSLLVSIPNPEPAPNDFFGVTVAVASGDKIVVGTPADNGSAPSAGRAYIFDAAGNLLALLNHTPVEASVQFGYSIAGVGSSRLAVGAPYLGMGTVDLFTFGTHADLTAAGVAPGGITSPMFAQQSVTSDALANNAVGSAQLATGAVTTTAIADAAVGNTQLAADAVNSSQIIDGTVTIADVATNTFWSTLGNSGTTTGTHFLGTTDNRAFEIRTLNQRVARFDTATNATGLLIQNVIFGHSANLASNGTAFGSVIGGGGNAGNPQIVGAAHDTVAGGVGNRATGGDATVAGGRRNIAPSLQSFVGGGFGNVGGGNNAFIGGGSNNTVSAANSVIGGGVSNTVSGAASVIGGGVSNTIVTSANAAIAGGVNNLIMGSANASFIGGGSSNVMQSPAFNSTIGGGFNNKIAAANSTIGGGLSNLAQSTEATIAGGQFNTIGATTFGSTIGGGGYNSVATLSFYSTIAGGNANTIMVSSADATIGGGARNLIDGTNNNATIAGGFNNRILGNAANSTIGGGQANQILDSAGLSTIDGGFTNVIQADADESVIGGGVLNIIQTNAKSSVIAGGSGNVIQTNAQRAVLGGGLNNTIRAAATNSLIAGGAFNTIQSNASGSAILGGVSNTVLASAQNATVAGGFLNSASASNSFAAGYRANAVFPGSFVWSDSSSPFATLSLNANQWVVRSVGGARFISGIDGSGATTSGVNLATGAGAWTSLSDRNAKKNFAEADVTAILEKLCAIPVLTWSYKTQDDTIRHIGPTAQDFKAAFNVGESDTGITTVDADGVALAAIQALAKENADLKQRNAEQDKLLLELRARLDALEKK